MPAYFQALNGEYTYQFFPLEQAMPNLYLKEEVSKNEFVIGGGVAHGDVSWQVTGVRHDPYILANPIVTEVEKSDETEVPRGKCLFEPLCDE